MLSFCFYKKHSYVSVFKLSQTMKKYFESTKVFLQVSYLAAKHFCCSIHENADVPEYISQYTVGRSLVFFIREGHVEGTSKDGHFFVRDW